MDAALRRKQTKWNSLYEAVVNTFIGLAVTMVASKYIYPLYDFHPSLQVNFEITVWFTILSIVRSYIVRRMWETNMWKRVFGK